MRLLLTSEAELCYLRGLQLEYVKHRFPSMEGMHCLDTVYCRERSINLAVFVDRLDLDNGCTRCLYIAIFNHNMQPILRKLELVVTCCLERNQVCIVDSTKLVVVERRIGKDAPTRIFFVSLFDCKPEKQCAEYIDIPKDRIVTGVSKNLHNSFVFIQLLDEASGDYDWIMCDVNCKLRHYELPSSNNSLIFDENHAYTVTGSDDGGKLYLMTAFSDISGIHNTELHGQLVTIVTTSSGCLYVYCNGTISAQLENIKELSSAHTTISATCFGAGDVYVFIHCDRSGVLLVASVSLQSSAVKLLLQCTNIQAYQYSSVLSPLCNHLLLLPSSTGGAAVPIILEISKYGSKYCVLGGKAGVWQSAPAALDAAAILSDGVGSKKHKKAKNHDVSDLNQRDSNGNDAASKFEIHNIDKHAQHMVTVAVQSRLEQIKRKISILASLADGKYLALIALRNMLRQMLCVALANRPGARGAATRIPAISCSRIVECVLKPFHLDSPTDHQRSGEDPRATESAENDAVINGIAVKDMVYQPIPNSWSVLVLIRVSNASQLPVFNLQANVHVVEPSIGSGVSCNIRVNSRIATYSGSTCMVNPNEEVWLFAKAELPTTLFTPPSLRCALSVSLSWTEIYSTSSKLSTYTSSGEASNVAELLGILSKDKHRSSLELALGWLPRAKQSKSVGLILVSPKDFMWNTNTQREHDIHRCKVAPYLLGRKLQLESSHTFNDALYLLLQRWLQDAERREVGAIHINSYVKSVNVVVEGGNELDIVDSNQLNIPVTHATTASQRVESILRCVSSIHIPGNHCISSHIIVYDDWACADGCDQVYMRLVANSALCSDRLVSMASVLQSVKSVVMKEMSMTSAPKLQLVSAGNECRFHLVRLASLYLLEEMKVLALAYREQKTSSSTLPQDSDVVLTVGSKLKIKNNLALGKLLLSRQLQSDLVISLLCNLTVT